MVIKVIDHLYISDEKGSLVWNMKLKRLMFIYGTKPTLVVYAEDVFQCTVEIKLLVDGVTYFCRDCCRDCTAVHWDALKFQNKERHFEIFRVIPFCGIKDDEKKQDRKLNASLV